MLIECTHCGTQYDVDQAVVDEKRTLTCETCGQEFIAGEAMEPEKKPPVWEYLPAWEEKEKYPSPLPRLWYTILQVMRYPQDIFITPSKAGYWPPIIFILIMTVFIVGVDLLYYQILGLPTIAELVLDDTEFELANPLKIILAIILAPMFTFVFAGILHLGLRLFFAGNGGYLATFRVMAYADAVYILYLIPWVGGFAVFIWCLVVLARGLAGAHRTGLVRVIAAMTIGFALSLIALSIPACFFGGIIYGVIDAINPGMP